VTNVDVPERNVVVLKKDGRLWARCDAAEEGVCEIRVAAGWCVY